MVTACWSKVTFLGMQSNRKGGRGGRGGGGAREGILAGEGVAPQSPAPFDFAWSKTDANSLSYGVDTTAHSKTGLMKRGAGVRAERETKRCSGVTPSFLRLSGRVIFNGG